MRILATALLLAGAQDNGSFKAKDRLVFARFILSAGADLRKEIEDMASVSIHVAVVERAKGGDLGRLVAAMSEAVEKNPRIRVRLAPFLPPDEAALRAFFEAVPPKFRAVVESRPIVWLAPSEKEIAPRLKEAYYLVGDRGPVDRKYVPGAVRDVPVASVGPGPDRDEEGRRYRKSWYAAVQSDATWAMLETWNDDTKGTGVHESEQYARKFVEFTRNYARRFRNDESIPAPDGKYATADTLVYSLKYNPREQGLRLLETARSRFATVRMAGLRVMTTKSNEVGDVRHLAFDVDDSFCYMKRRSLRVSVEFWDIGKGAFSVEYDSADRKLDPERRRAKRTEEVRFENAGRWRRVGFDLPDAWFGNGQEGGGDFRIRIRKRGLMLRLVTVKPK